MKRILVLLICLCFIFTGCTPKQPDDGLKEFKTSYGLSFRLPEDAEELDSVAFPLFISNQEKIKDLPEHDFAAKAYYIGVNPISLDSLILSNNDVDANNLKEFASMLAQYTFGVNTIEKFQDGYVFDFPGDGEYRRVLCLEGEKCYYMIVFGCADGSDVAKQQLEKLLSNVKVVKADNDDFISQLVGVREFRGRIPLEFSLYDSNDKYTEYRYGETAIQMGLFEKAEFSQYPKNSHEAAVYLLNPGENEVIVDRGDYSYLEIKADYGYALLAYWRGENGIYGMQFNYYDSGDREKIRDMALGWFDTFRIGQ